MQNEILLLLHRFRIYRNKIILFNYLMYVIRSFSVEQTILIKYLTFNIHVWAIKHSKNILYLTH